MTFFRMVRLALYPSLIISSVFMINVLLIPPAFAVKVIKMSFVSQHVENLDHTPWLAQYKAIVPDDYDPEHEEYSVVYWFHGMGGNYNGFHEYFRGGEAMDEAFQLGHNRFIVISANFSVRKFGDETYNGKPILDSYGLNASEPKPGDPKAQFEDFFLYELVPHVEQHFSVIAQKSARAAAGLSMGGYDALIYSIKYPHLFGVVGAHSPTLRSLEQVGAYKKQFGSVGFKNNNYYLNDPITRLTVFAETLPAHLFLDIGGSDPWLGRAQECERVLAKHAPEMKDYEYRFEIGTDPGGGHHEDYWRWHLKKDPDGMSYGYVSWWADHLEPVRKKAAVSEPVPAIEAPAIEPPVINQSSTEQPSVQLPEENKTSKKNIFNPFKRIKKFLGNKNEL